METQSYNTFSPLPLNAISDIFMKVEWDKIIPIVDNSFTWLVHRKLT